MPQDSKHKYGNIVTYITTETLVKSRNFAFSGKGKVQQEKQSLFYTNITQLLQKRCLVISRQYINNHLQKKTNPVKWKPYRAHHIICYQYLLKSIIEYNILFGIS